jgi:hypothetical protein
MRGKRDAPDVPLGRGRVVDHGAPIRIARGDGTFSTFDKANTKAEANTVTRIEPGAAPPPVTPTPPAQHIGPDIRPGDPVPARPAQAPQLIQPPISVPVQVPVIQTSAPLVLVPPRPKKTTVVLASDRMGKLRAKVDYVGLDDKCIALGYIDDDDSSVIEPPLCGSDAPLTVEIASVSYACIYGGWTFTAPGPLGQVFWVVLARLGE